MTAGGRRGRTVVAMVGSVLVGVLAVGGLFGVAGCSTGTPAAGQTAALSTGSASVGSPAATDASTPADHSTAAGPETPAATRSGSPAAPAASGAAGVTSTPGLQLAGPQPLPRAARLTPVRVRVPAIGVDSALEALHTRAGVLQPPADPLVAGWWSGGPVPGDPGPAVIAGHLDSYSGPAVFVHLSTLRAGDLIDVTRSNGSTVVFVVDSVDVYQKSAFPTQAVYGATPGVALRLITCGGTFDRARQLYLANVIVYASLRS